MEPSHPPLGRWKVSFEVLQDSGKRKLAPVFLLLWPKNWLALVNHKDAPIVGNFLQNGEVFYAGSSVRLPSHLVFVQACLVSPPGFPSFLEAIPFRWKVICSALDSMDAEVPMRKSETPCKETDSPRSQRTSAQC
jgi:hypothetical protein